MPRAFQCRGCLFKSVIEWIGLCPGCHRPYNIREIASDMRGAERIQAAEGEVVSLQDAVDVEPDEEERIVTGIGNLDKLLGGGFVPGGVYLLCGDPGIGKSTLVVQIFHALAKQKHDVLYLIGEQTVSEVARRAKKMNLGKIPARFQAARETDLDSITDKIQDIRPAIACVDSIQFVDADEDLEVGGAAAVKLTIRELNKVAKSECVALIIIGHITKDGAIGGPRSLEHTVDASLYFSGDPKKPERILRCDQKNRFGRTPARAAFMMSDEHGLVAVDDPNDDATEPTDHPPMWEPPPPPPEPKKSSKKTTTKTSSKQTVLKLVPPPTEESIKTAPTSPTAKTAKTTAKTAKTTAKNAKPIPSVLEPDVLEVVQSWRSHDGLTTDDVLKQSCDVEGCSVGPGRACTSASGKREAGFHESRVNKARADKKGKPENAFKRLLGDDDEPPAPSDPFEKNFGAKPRLKVSKKPPETPEPPKPITPKPRKKKVTPPTPPTAA